jgi:hypothetical protein
MDYQSLLANLNERLALKRMEWTKDDYRTITGKKSSGGRLLGFMSRGYYQREKLFAQGRIVFGYCYKSYTDRDFSKPYLVWIVFSPMSAFETDPTQYEITMERLQPLIDNEKPDKSERKLRNALINPVTEPKYFPLPQLYSGDKLMYVSTTYVFPNLVSQLKLGIVPIIIAPDITKEIMIVPDTLL